MIFCPNLACMIFYDPFYRQQAKTMTSLFRCEMLFEYPIQAVLRKAIAVVGHRYPHRLIVGHIQGFDRNLSFTE